MTVKKIFVGAIPKTLTQAEFQEYFAKFGEADEITLMKKPYENHNRGFGFVKYKTTAVADAVVEQTHQINDNPLTVNYAKVPLHGDTRRFYVGNINTEKITETDIKEHFDKYGEVSDHFIMKSKGFGFLAITNLQHEKLDQVLNHNHFINNIQVTVELAKPKPKTRPPPRSEYGPRAAQEYRPSRYGVYAPRYAPYDRDKYRDYRNEPYYPEDRRRAPHFPYQNYTRDYEGARRDEENLNRRAAPPRFNGTPAPEDKYPRDGGGHGQRPAVTLGSSPYRHEPHKVPAVPNQFRGPHPLPPGQPRQPSSDVWSM